MVPQEAEKLSEGCRRHQSRFPCGSSGVVTMVGFELDALPNYQGRTPWSWTNASNVVLELVDPSSDGVNIDIRHTDSAFKAIAMERGSYMAFDGAKLPAVRWPLAPVPQVVPAWVPRLFGAPPEELHKKLDVVPQILVFFVERHIVELPCLAFIF